MDTIFALSTAPGKSGIAVVRVSGPHALATLHAFGVAPLPSPRRATLTRLMTGEALLDNALVLTFPAPASFTGENTVEYHLHGSRAVIRAVLDVLATLPGCRPADAGEFTRRAFLQGKIDLTAAEGLADLLDAETEAQRKQALRFLKGDGEAFYRALRQDIVEALALMEAYIDFPDEDIPNQVVSDARTGINTLTARIETQLKGATAAERVRDGVHVAIIGPPNAGKSSLMNLLAGRDVAIVSEIAGTTRDVIEVHLDIGGYAVVVADTAGLRKTGDAVEREGVRRSLRRAEEADIRILVLDAQEVASDPWFVISQALLPITGHPPLTTLILLNKSDLLPSPTVILSAVKDLFPQAPLLFSTRTQGGMNELMARLGTHVAQLAAVESSFVARARHRHHLDQSLFHLHRYLSLSSSGFELQCEELRRAAVEIGRITGMVSPEEVLGQIFSRFCIGK